MTSRTPRRSPLAMVVLALLAEAPMHPYRMQQLIEERHKDQVVNVAQRNSIYQTIDRLQRADLIAVQETSRDEHRPERTVYRITDDGAQTLRQWLAEMLSTPAREFPEFPAALAFLPLVSAAEALAYLEVRAATLRDALVRLDAELAGTELPRVFLVEVDYARTVTDAELRWVRTLIDDVRSGEVRWDDASPGTFAEAFED